VVTAVGRYFSQLVEEFGSGWNRFWLTAGDPYVLGPLRVVVGLVALYLHATYTPDLARFLAADGLAPVEIVESLEQSAGVQGLADDRRVDVPALSYLSYLSTQQELHIAHAAGFVVLAIYTLGWHTRIAAVLALVVVLAYVQRAPMFSGLAEALLAILMFYLCIGPAGASWSLDSWIAGRRRRPDDRAPLASSISAGVALRLLQVHLAMFYATMGLSKLMSDAWWSGDGIWWLLARPESRLVDLTFLASHGATDKLLDAWCHAQVAFELCFALLIWNRLARPLLIAVSLVLWPLLTLATGQTAFLPLILAANLAFVDSAWLRQFLRRAVASDSGEPSASAAA
jgi:hypothetical protein